MKDCPSGNSRSLVKEISSRGCGNGTGSVKPVNQGKKPKPKTVKSRKNNSMSKLKGTGL
jgi:hypothetical protein